MLMKKGLLLLNVNNTVLHFCLSKKGGQKGSKLPKCVTEEVNKGQKSYHRSRMGQNAGQKGSKILPKGRSYQKWVKKEAQSSKRVKDLRELLMLTENP
jgi:hypothetical protein